MGAHHAKLTKALCKVGQRVWLANKHSKYSVSNEGRIASVSNGGSWVHVSWALAGKPNSAHRRAQLRVEKA